ncbi:hypothetical protein OU426_01220 [Frigidibacter sp. RF13]|uniref:hypothetical protein n=1 Tax=Frigidibacter sp. RF13 TaxID=2997340 RepID=UPI0022716545|nr:hypothetical protein [Frigidibacter sp. RF13]MCY1125461.1 hypothetical protein [Frigidibacter sp. RF13]
MKPRFALELTNEAVSLLERGPDGWVRLGEAAFDAEDFDARLAMLREIAQKRAPEGFTSKLILPNSQILYFECQVTGPDQATRRAEIRAALDGRTPYPLSELVFDFSRSGNRARVAVVAGVTLDEAEAFADANGFNPVAFVAAPEPDRFAGEPFFGPTSVVSNYLADGIRLDRDQDPVRVVADLPSDASPPEIDPEALPAEAPEAGTPAERVSEEATTVETGASETDPRADIKAETADGAATDPVEDEAPFIAVMEDEEHETAAPPPETVPPVEPATVDEPLLAEMSPIANIVPAPDPSDDGADPALAEDDAETEDDEDTVGQPATMIPTFHSQRDHGEAGGKPQGEAGSRLATIVPRLGGAASLPEAESSTARVARLVVEKRGGSTADLGLTATRPSGLRAGLPTWALPAGLAAAVAVTALGAWALFLREPVVVETAAAPETVTATGSESSTFPAVTTGADPTPAPVPRAVPDLPTPTISDAAPAPTASGAADTSGSADLGADTSVARAKADPAGADALPASDPALPPQPAPPPFGTLLRYAADGSIIATPDGVTTPGGFTLFAGRPPRLPTARPESVIAAAQPQPTPDAETPTESSADPAEAPETVAPPDPRVVGKAPRGRPATLVVPAPPVETTPPAAPENAPDASPAPGDQTTLPPLSPPVDPRHAARRPSARPDKIVAAAEAKRNADEAIAEAAASAARAEAEAAERALESASPLAVTSSRKPAQRSAAAVSAAAAARLAAATPAPASVDSGAVEAALAEAQASAEPEPASAPATEDIDEPELTEGIATLPTTRTVAKKSTFANAIDLGDINLIGVYGSSAARRALVRLPSGRYVKVKVGDRLDGGQVAAIGDTELRYVKKGKTLVLRIMDKG